MEEATVKKTRKPAVIAVYGQTVPKMVSEINVKYIIDYCREHKEAAEWYLSCYKDTTFMQLRKDFAEKFLGMSFGTKASAMEAGANELRELFK